VGPIEVDPADLRLKWIGDVVCTALEVPTTEFEALLRYNSTAQEIVQWLEHGEKGTSLSFYSNARLVEESEMLQRQYGGHESKDIAYGGGIADLSAMHHIYKGNYLSNRPHIGMLVQGLPKAPRNVPVRTCFFIKSCAGAVQKPESSAQCNAAMSSMLEYSVLPDNALLMLHQVIKDIYVPMTDPDSKLSNAYESLHDHFDGKTAASGQTGSAGLSATDSLDVIRSDLVVNLQKFSVQLSHAIQQATGNVQLPMPRDLEITKDNIDLIASDPDAVSELERYVDLWVNYLTMEMEREAAKSLAAQKPVAEINLWRDRYTALSTLHEQLENETVGLILEVLRRRKSDCLTAFNNKRAELHRAHLEAKDNVKFMSTLERHFKNINSGNLNTIIETIPSMMNSLRMIWIVSRYYGKDGRLAGLMQLIAKEIAEKVSEALKVHTLLKKPPTEAIPLINKGKEVLTLWQQEFLKAKAKVDESTSARWDFARQKLFDDTEYMVGVCEQLLEVMHTVDEFNSFLSPQLKTITGDHEGIDEVKKLVAGLLQPILDAQDIFSHKHQANWDRTMKMFHEQVQVIEARTSSFINQSFTKLRSAEGAFNLLQNFDSIRPSIRDQLKSKYTNVLDQYLGEVEVVAKQFEQGRANPPLFKNQPRVAGAIAWARALYHRIKKPITQFKMTRPAILEDAKGRSVRDRYVTVAKMILSFQEAKLREWRAHVERNASDLLHQNVLGTVLQGWVVPLIPGVTTTQGLPMGSTSVSNSLTTMPHSTTSTLMGGRATNITTAGTGGVHTTVNLNTTTRANLGTTYSGASLKTSRGQTQRSINQSGQSSQNIPITPNSDTPYIVVDVSKSPKPSHPLAQPVYRIVVNFSEALEDIIAETKHLDRLGLGAQVPDIALDITLQEKKYHSLVAGLNSMLIMREELLDKLSNVERDLLSKRITTLNSTLDPGFTTYNWTSLGITELI